MPLRDPFRDPVAVRSRWDRLHGTWPVVITQHLNRNLPSRYVAAPTIHLGSSVEIDLGALYEDNASVSNGTNGNGSVATAVWAPPRPTLTDTIDLPPQDTFGIRIYDERMGQTVVAAIELVSPSNKDRPESRQAFVTKCLALLHHGVSLVIVDPVTDRDFNLYGDLLTSIDLSDRVLGEEPPAIYAVSCRGLQRPTDWLLESWWHPLGVGQPLPTLPLWLAVDLAVPLDLEATYEQACRDLRIP